jgi:hypothetical protein
MDVGGEIRLGSMLFTLVEPHQGHEVAYNRWYERDHFNAGCMIGPWLYAGRRWVATRPLKDLRAGAEKDLFGGVDRGSYLALYFVIDGKHDEHFAWGLRQVGWLHENGRMFEHRDHVHTLLYRFRGATGPADGVPPELALHHPYGGLIVTVVERAGGAAGDAAFDADLATLGDTDLALAFDPIPLPPGAPVNQPGLERLDQRAVVLRFVEGAPDAAWASHMDACASVDAGGNSTVLWTAPFIPTIPGTDIYTDQLW